MTEIGQGGLVIMLFVGYGILWKLKKRQVSSYVGRDPEVVYSDDRPSQQFFARLTRILSIVLAFLIAAHMVGLKGFYGLQQGAFLSHPISDFVGFGMGLGGLWLCFLAQRQMGNAWRVGIDRHHKTELVTDGVFSKIRNPTYSGLFLVCGGMLVILPTMLISIWTLVFYIILEFQVRLEEEFLAGVHGDAYARYSQNTKRYVPNIY